MRKQNIVAIAGVFIVILALTGYLIYNGDDKDDNKGTSAIDSSASVTEEEKSVQAEENENFNAVDAQVKTETLDKASKMAELGNYVSAIEIIKNAQTTQGDDADYAHALNTYCTAYKEETISIAEELANNEDFLGAIQKIKESKAVIGEDSELSAMEKQYENSYVSEVVEKAEKMIAEADFDGAEELVNTAKKQFPNNQALDEESKKIVAARPVESETIMEILAGSVLSESGTYKAYLGSDSINAFAEDQHNAFSINTAASYNMWGGGEQNVSFRISKFTFETLSFIICGETGTSGEVTVEVYMDRSVEDGSPDYSFTLDDAPYPVNAVVDVSDRMTMAIKVINHAGHENRIVFYGFEGT